MRVLGKQEWLVRHGQRDHHWKFRDLGWWWTPARCECPVPCLLDTNQKRR